MKHLGPKLAFMVLGTSGHRARRVGYDHLDPMDPMDPKGHPTDALFAGAVKPIIAGGGAPSLSHFPLDSTGKNNDCENEGEAMCHCAT